MMIGKTIARYKILKKLGEGGMGVVYKAQDTKLERTVAVKFLPSHIAGDAEERTRFEIEAKAAAALNHPNIATLYTIEEADDQVFLVMEYIQGVELKEKISAGTLAIEEVLKLAKQITAGLRAAHSNNVIHRDIKSSNIMITDEGQVKIMDFGLAKVRGGAQVTKAGTTLGTVAYMSPEQSRGEEADQRSDIWAFGVVLYEMLTGTLPFNGDYEQAVAYAVINEEPEPAAAQRSEIPEKLQSILDKALTKAPENRYPDVDVLLTDLEAVKIEGKAEPVAAPVGKSRLKHFVYGGLALSLVLVVLVGFWLLPQKVESIDSIAVLPFENLSGDPQQEYFTAGMHEALISELSKIGALRTISRTSVMRYKESMASISEIAEELDVDAVVEGSALRSEDKVRITVQLLATRPERNLWAETFDRDYGDVLAMHSEVARQIANEIQVTVTQDEASRMTTTASVNTRAYEIYLLGRHHYRLGWMDLYQAIEYFEQAIAIDSTFAPAYAGLALSYLGLGQDFNMISPEETWPNVISAATRALELDDQQADAHLAQALVRYWYEWDWVAAENGFKRVLELNPNSINALNNYVWMLINFDRKEEAKTYLEKASKLDFSRLGQVWQIWFHNAYGRIEDAIQLAEARKIELPDYPGWYWALALIYLRQGQFEKVLEELNAQLPLMQGDVVDEVALLGHTYGRLGRHADAMKMLDQLQELSRQGTYVSPALHAWIYAGLGDADNAMLWLDKGYEERAHRMGMDLMTFDLILAPISHDARYQALLEKMDLKL